MKIHRKIMILLMVLLVSMGIHIKAADYAEEPSIDTIPTAEVTMTPSVTEAKKGDIVTVTILAKGEKGIAEFESELEYDTEKLNLTKIYLKDWYMDISGTDDKSGKTSLAFIYGAIGAPDEYPKEVELAVLEFKVSDKVALNESLSIKLKELFVLGAIKIEEGTEDEEYEVEYKTSDVETTIKRVGENEPGQNEEQTPSDDGKVALSSIAVESNATKLSYKVGEKFDKTGMVIKATYSDGTSKEITDYTYSPNGELSLEDKAITITYTEGGVTKTVTQAINVEEPKDPATDDGKKDETIADKPINNAGIEQYALTLIFATLVTVALYIKCRNYSDIK